MVLVGLCALGIVFGNMQNGSRTAEHVDRVTSTIRSFVIPLGTPLSNMTRATSGFFTGIVTANRLVRENRQLREQAALFASYAAHVETLNQEVTHFRAMAGFGAATGKTRVPADVIGLSINENRLTIDVGSRQGLRAGCPVENSEGMVGTVEDVEANRSQVLLITSAGLQAASKGKPLLIGALDINRNPPPAGLLRGENASTLSLLFMDPKAPVQIGDTIITSGYSDKIPRGLVIGKVIQVEPSEEYGTLKARVDPAFSAGNLETVYVLT